MCPEVSVLMPVYNCETHIAESIKSILNQSFEDLELIIIDGGSSDHTCQIIKSFNDRRVRLIEHKERFGLVESRNEGLRVAKSNLIAMQDADDVSQRQRIEKQYKRFLLDEKLAVLGTYYSQIDENGRNIEREIVKVKVSYEDFKIGMQMCNGSVMFRKEIALREGLFNPLLKQCEDYEFYFRLSRRGYKIMNMTEFLYSLRQHARRLSVSKWKEQLLFFFLVQDIYSGRLQEERLKDASTRDLDFLYSLLSFEGKKNYRKFLISRFVKSKRYFHGFHEFLVLIQLDHKEFSQFLTEILLGYSRKKSTIADFQ